jgi:membrane protease YdiL (CAAX protease family)
MLRPSHTPWHPDRRWADPLIALLLLLALLAAAFTLLTRGRAAERPAERVTLQGRLAELALAGPQLLSVGPKGVSDWSKASAQMKEPWDGALLAILRVEAGQESAATETWVTSATPPGQAGVSFRQACLAAYAHGPMPSTTDRREVRHRLGSSYGADLLEARLLDREGGGDFLRAQARKTLLTHLIGLAVAGLAVLVCGAAGLLFGAYLLATHQAPRPPLPTWSLSGRAATLVFLTWFLAFFLAGNLAGLLLLPLPGLRWLAIPLGYGLHALVGLRLLCWAENLTLAELWHRLAPGRPGRDLAWGLAFLTLALGLVIAVAVLSNLLLRPTQSPQRDLQDLVRGLSGWGPSLALFLTVAVLAPIFEELLFRGFLLPVLTRSQGMAAALALSALLFGAIHLQPMGLPILSALGLVLGLAIRHTGTLRTPILVHACWNAGQFLLMRLLA